MSGSPRARAWIAGVALAAAVLVALAPVAGNGFVNYDDDTYVTDNREVARGLDPAGVRWAFVTRHAETWHPLTWLSHMLDREMFGPDPLGPHLTSLLLHLANTLLLFSFLRGATGSSGRSAIAAALFGVHPLHVESVAWISERKDVLSGLFAMLALLAHLRFARSPRPVTWVAVAGAVALGLLAHPMLATLPLLLVLADSWPLERRLPAPRLFAEKALLFAMAAGVAMLVAQRFGLATGSLEQYPFGLRVANALVSYGDYLLRTVWPRGLAVFYPYPFGGLPGVKVAASAIFLVGVTAAAIRFRGKLPYLFFGWLWYLVSLFPVIGLVQMGEQASADRYTYLPLVGIFVAVAWGGGDLAVAAGRRIGAERAARRLAFSGAVLAILALAALARGQARVWKNSFTLFEHALAVTERNHVAHLNLGLAHAADGRLDEAIRHLAEAVALRPDHAVARSALGEHLGLAGRHAEAVRELEASVRIDGRRPEPWGPLALHLALSGRVEEALPRFESAARARPLDAEIRYNWGTALARTGRLAEAVARFEEALRLDPDHFTARHNLGVALYMLGERERGESEIRAAREAGYAEDSPDNRSATAP